MNILHKSASVLIKRVASSGIMLALFFFQAHAATITFTITNSVGEPDTNAFRLIQVSGVRADGTWVQTGTIRRITPNSSGIVTTNLLQGNYLATNQFLANSYAPQVASRRGLLIAVPSGSGSYSAAELAISGDNVFNYTPGVNTIIGTGGFSATNTGGGVWLIDGGSFVPPILASNNISIVTNSGTLFISASSNSTATNLTGQALIQVTNAVTSAAYVARLDGGATNLTVRGTSDPALTIGHTGDPVQWEVWSTGSNAYGGGISHLWFLAGGDNRIIGFTTNGQVQAYTLWADNDIFYKGVLLSNTVGVLNSNTVPLQATNIVSVNRAGTASANEGIYAYVSNKFTNSVNGNTISNHTGTTWHLRNSSGTILYTSTSGVVNPSWTVVDGGSPGPNVNYGALYRLNGHDLQGWLNSTNLDARFAVKTFAGITNAIGYHPATNGAAGSGSTETVSTATPTLLSIATNAPNYAFSVLSQTNSFTSLATTNAGTVVYTNMLMSVSNALHGILVSTNETSLVQLVNLRTATITNTGDTMWEGDVTILGTITFSGGDGNGDLTVATITSPDASGLTNLNASNIGLGTVPLARLSGITSNQIADTAIDSQDLRVGIRLTNAANFGTAFSSLGTGVSSEQFGSGGQATGLRGTTIGNAAFGGDGANVTVVGASSAGSNVNVTVIGAQSIGAADRLTIVGSSVSSTSTNGTLIGQDHTVTGPQQIVVGYGNTVGGHTNITIANGLNYSASNSIAIGGAPSGNNQIMMGTTNHHAIFPGNMAVNGTLTNGSLHITNANAAGNPLIRYTTNVLVVYGSGNFAANAQYVYRGAQYTNDYTGYTITNNAGTWVIKDASLASLYSSTTLENSSWTLGTGDAPAANSTVGYTNYSSGVIQGIIYSTNLITQITNLATLKATNAAAAGDVLQASGSTHYKWTGLGTALTNNFVELAGDTMTGALTNSTVGTVVIGGTSDRSIDGFGNTLRLRGGSSGFNFRSGSSGEQTLYTLGDGTGFDQLLHNGAEANQVSTGLGDSKSVGATHSSNPSFNGGSGSALHEVDAPANSLWPNKTNAVFGISTTGSEQNATNVSALILTNILNQIATNGQLAAWTNAGMNRVLFAIDGGWQFTNRVSGELAANTNRFPGSITNIINHLHNNNSGISLYNYYIAAVPAAMGAASDTALLVAMFSGGAWFHPSGTAFQGSAGDAFPQPATTPDTVFTDATTFYGWGVDDWAVQNGSDYTDIYGYTMQMFRQLSHAVLYRSLGYRTDHLSPGSRFMTLNMFGDYPHDAAMHMMNSRSVNAFGIKHTLYGADGLSWGMGAVRANMPEMKRWPDNGPFIRMHSNGDSGSWGTNAYRGFFTMASLYFMDTFICYHQNGVSIPISAVQTSTNQLMLKIHQNHQPDNWNGFRRWPRITYDGGSNSVHVRWLSPTKRAVAFVNEGAAATNLTVTWAQLEILNGSMITLTNVWEATNQVTSASTFSYVAPAATAGYFYVDVLAQPEHLLARPSTATGANALVVEANNGADMFAFDTHPASSSTAAIWGPSGTRTASNYRFAIDEDNTFVRINTISGGAFQIYDNNSTLIATYTAATGLALSSGTYRHGGNAGMTTNILTFDGTRTNRLHFSGGVLTNVVNGVTGF